VLIAPSAGTGTADVTVTCAAGTSPVDTAKDSANERAISLPLTPAAPGHSRPLPALPVAENPGSAA
jgi:hypothetical protein